MPKEKAEKSLCMSGLRHAEYYGMQEVFDGLYAKSSKNETFTNLMNIILKRENILLAYRNIKSNDGSKTPGTDGVTFDDIGKLMPDEVIDTVRFITIGSTHGYRPKPVRRKEIPKPYDPTKTRPLGIPCVWDRLVQQCIKQVMEPICEAKFSENSYGFRPNRSAENAIARAEFLIQNTRLHYVVEFDVKGFFDNVDHSKLIKQIWSLGIRDKNLLFVLKRILKAPIRLENGAMEYPTKGTPQGGIISPLLANIVLNELDQWVDSQWQDNPVTAKYKTSINANGSINKSNAYKFMRRTNLKEMYIVRYADDFRIFCRTKDEAERTMKAVTQWLMERLHLEVSPTKTKIVNVKHLFSVLISFSTYQNKYAFDGVSAEGSGKTAVEIDKEIAAKYEGILTDEKVQQMMNDFAPTHDLHGLNAMYLYQNATQSAAFSRFSDKEGNWNGLSVSDVFGNEEIKIGYVDGWLSTSKNMVRVFIVLALAVIIMLAPIFSGEYEGVDNIILTSKYGKTKCATAKVAAGILTAILTTALVAAFNLLLALIFYGTEGLDCSILFAPSDYAEGFIPFNITCGTLLKYQILLAFTCTLSVTGITLLISAISKNQIVAFVASMAIFLFPVLLPITEANPLFRLIGLLPLYHVQAVSLLSVEQMSNGMLYAVWAIPTALLFLGIGAVISRRVFAKHQVS